MPVFVFLHNYDNGPEEGARFVEFGKEHVKHPLVLKLECRFPEAPAKRSESGRPVSQWFTMGTIEEDGSYFFVGEPVLLIERITWIRGYINGLVAQGTPASEIVLCGVHHGAMLLSAAVVLLQEIRLGGVVMISGFVPNVETVHGWVAAQEGQEVFKNLDTPLLMIHGSNDRRIDAKFRRKVDRFFLDLGYTNYRAVEAMYMDDGCKQITDWMWMFVWEFVVQALGGP